MTEGATAIRIVGVVGAGAMGRGIAQVAMTGGYDVRLMDASAEVAQAARDFIQGLLRRNVDKGRMSQQALDETMARLTLVSEVGALGECDLVVEAVVEKLEVKQSVFADLEAVVGEGCILASNTSSLSITAIAAKANRPERVAGFHFFNPVPLMRLVEVIDGVRTDPAVGDALMDVGRRMGREPVRVSDAPGFLVNQIGRGYTIESAHIVDEAIASPHEIDRIMRDLVGFRMGPFELMDLTGLDVTHPATELIHSQFFGEPRYRPSLMMAQRTAAGVLGRKSGGGFYRYEDGKAVVPAEEPAREAMPSRVWISNAEPEARAALVDALGGSGVTIEQGARPGAQTLCLVTPIGEDATTVALKEGLDPERTVAVETLFPMDKRRVIMGTPATSAAMLAAARACLAADGIPVSVIRESPGFIAQRVVAMIVNICSAIAQQEAATPDDIDKAPTLALNYPAGPFTLADQIGPDRVLRVLEAMHAAYGDPRYRPSLWLKRRAKLGLSLKTPDRQPASRQERAA